MKIILEEKIRYKTRIKDFGVDPVNKRIITTGDKLVFLKNGKVEKEIAGKIKKCEVIKYIKEKNQFFVSSAFLVSTGKGKVYKCDAIKKRIVETVFDLEKNIEVTNFTGNGRIIYIENDILFSYDPNVKELIASDCLIEGEHKGNYRIFTSGENLIIRYKGNEENTNTINIFDNRLVKIFDIRTEKNHTFSKIVGLDYIAGTEDGEIEIWRILEEEMYDSIKISDMKITYIEKNEMNYFIALENGDIAVTDSKFKILKKVNVFENIPILKICIIEDEIFALGENSNIVKIKIIDESNEAKNHLEKIKFLSRYNINNEYYDFFTVEKITEIDSFFNQLQIQGVSIPEKDMIFRGLSGTIGDKKICLIENGTGFFKKIEKNFKKYSPDEIIVLENVFPEDNEGFIFWKSVIDELVEYILKKNKKIKCFYENDFL